MFVLYGKKEELSGAGVCVDLITEFFKSFLLLLEKKKPPEIVKAII